MMLQYVAKRSLLTHHTVDEVCTIEIEVTELLRSRRVQKSVVRAFSGRTETLYHHSDSQWSVTFAPVFGFEKDQLTEFLDSTSGGETFLAWLYGQESEPVRVQRADTGYGWQPFVRNGGIKTDLFTTSITIREIE